MGRVLALDYGLKRTGIAVTDPLKIIASPLDTLHTPELFGFLKKYCEQEDVEVIVVGMPKTMSDQDTHATQPVRELINHLKKNYPGIEIVEEDERFTSKMAVEAMIQGGMKKKDRRKKGNIDKVSATLILQSYLESRGSF